MSKVINKQPFEIQVDEYELADWFLRRIPKEYWHLWGALPVATDNVDTRDPSLFLRITLDRQTNQIRVADAHGTEPEVKPIEAPCELRESYLKQAQEAERGRSKK